MAARWPRVCGRPVCATRFHGLPACSHMDAAGSHRGRAPWVCSFPLRAAPNSAHTPTCLPCMVVNKFTSSSLIGMSGSKDSLVVGGGPALHILRMGSESANFLPMWPRSREQATEPPSRSGPSAPNRCTSLSRPFGRPAGALIEIPSFLRAWTCILSPLEWPGCQGGEPPLSCEIVQGREGHKDGYRGIRDARDHAREQLYALRDQLKGYWRQSRRDPQPVAEGNNTLADLDDVPEEPLLAQERHAQERPAKGSKPYPRDDGETEEQQPCSTKPVRPKRTSRKAPPPAYAPDDEPGYEIIDRPAQTPMPRQSSEECRRSTRLSSSRPASSKDPSNATAKKRKPSSGGKAAEIAAGYWEWDGRRRRHFHRHADGTMTWAEDSGDGDAA